MNNDQRGGRGRAAIISIGAILLVGILFVMWIKGTGTYTNGSPLSSPSNLTLPMAGPVATEKSSDSPKVSSNRA